MFGFFGLSFGRMWAAAGKKPTLNPPPVGSSTTFVGMMIQGV